MNDDVSLFSFHSCQQIPSARPKTTTKQKAKAKSKNRTIDFLCLCEEPFFVSWNGHLCWPSVRSLLVSILDIFGKVVKSISESLSNV